MSTPRSGKADPDCPKCEGRGVRTCTVRAVFCDMGTSHAPDIHTEQTLTQICPCASRNDQAPPEVA